VRYLSSMPRSRASLRSVSDHFFDYFVQLEHISAIPVISIADQVPQLA